MTNDNTSSDTSSSRTSSHPQEQLLLELDMYQDIAVARGSTYDTLNKRMDRCQENIETVSDDIQRLQGGTNIKKPAHKYKKLQTNIKKKGGAGWDLVGLQLALILTLM